MDQNKISQYHVKIGKTWLESPNCWRETFTNGSWTYELSIIGFTLIFLLINFSSKILANWYGHPLNIRPTIVASGGHAAYTAIASTTIICLGPEYYWLWQKIILPSSLGYFFHDIIVYCIPRRDFLITFHHLIMIWCHYPSGEEVGAFWGGAGDPTWAVWIAMMGYTSEFAVPLLGFRWWLLHTLDRNTALFTGLGYLIILSFGLRCVVMGYLLLFQVLPRFHTYMYYQQRGAFAFIIIGHMVVLVLSAHWLRTIFREGISTFVHFRKRPKVKGPFQFRTNFVTYNMPRKGEMSDTSDTSDDEKKDK